MQIGNWGKSRKEEKDDSRAEREAEGGSATEQPTWTAVESSGQPALQVEDLFEGLQLPETAPEAEHNLAEPCRRSSPRIRAPLKVLHLLPGPKERYEALEMTLILKRDRPVLADCLLLDVSAGGIGIITTVDMEIGDTMTLCAHHQSDADPLFASVVKILNKRPFETEQTLPAAFQHKSLLTYGMRLNAEALAALAEATEQSLALARSRS